jgi:MoaA/NifB/PqqE/SkfB family radical SAM enzyme
MKYHIYFTKAGSKHVRSTEYNYDFDLVTGNFRRWGKNYEDDPTLAPAPELLDIEISTACHGVGGPCKFCYKSNGPAGQNMSLDTFKRLFYKLNPVITQVAFGIGDVDANSDMLAIFAHCRENGVIPNVTINGARMTPELYQQLAKLCGAVAVSRYDADTCYNAVSALHDAGLKQVNIHALLSAETYDQCLQTLKDCATDPRLVGKIRAVVFLAAKPKGRGDCLSPLRDVDKYRVLIEKAQEIGVGFGFDSCSAPLFLAATQNHPRAEEFKELAEPCESTLFSLYIDVTGRVWPCSFLADTDFPRIMAQDVTNFQEIWQHPGVVSWREKLLATATSSDALVPGCRECPVYREIYPAKKG